MKKSSGGKNKTVFIGMSGGVDSSVAAYLLKKQGYQAVGVFMRCVGGDGPSTALGVNCAERDAEDARRVAEHLRIPFYVWDFEKEYKKDVVRYMIDGYRRGETPNPDVMCNRQIKFGLFLKKALAAGADFVATGHYVRAKRQALSAKLFNARDANKDQSYFLWTLTQEQLKYCLFPIGDYTKPKVRDIARRAGLSTADKKDSQGICFLGKFSVADFLKTRIKPRRGAMTTTAGEKVGEHDGAWFYTIGQRRLGVNYQLPITNCQLKDRRPLYVAEKNIRTNTIVVAEGDDNPTLYKKEVILRDVNFITPSNYSLIRTNKRIVGIPVMARVRYRQPLSEAILVRQETREKRQEDQKSKNLPYPMSHVPCRFLLVFTKPVKFVAPGQSAVFYLPAGASAKAGSKNMEMLGGGIIEGAA